MASLGELAVYLRADMDGWTKSMSKAQKDIKSLAKEASIGFSIASAAVGGFAAKSLMAYAEQESAIARLDAALAVTGQNSIGMSAKLQALASEMQTITTFGDETVLSVIGLGMQMGISADRIDEATRAAIGLTSRGMDLNAAMTLIARASQGSFNALSRMGIVLKEGATNEEKFNELLKRGSAEFAIARAGVDTLTGRYLQLKNMFGEVMEAFGLGLETIFGVKVGLASLKTTVGDFANSLSAYFKNMDEVTKGTYRSIGMLAAGLALLPPAYYAATVAAKAFNAAALGIHIFGGGVIVMAKYAASLYTTAAVMATVTGTTTLAAAAQLAFASASAVASAALVATGWGTAIAAVAALGYGIGYLIQRYTGLGDAIGIAAEKLNLFGQKEAEARGKAAEDRSKELTDLMKRRRAGEVIPEAEKEVKQQRKADTAVDEKELKARESYEKTLADYRYEQMSDQQKLNQLLEDQKRLQQDINASSGAKKFGLQEEFLKKQEKVDKLNEKRASEAKDLDSSLAKARQSEIESRMTDEQKLFDAELKRRDVLAEVENLRQAGDAAGAKKKLEEAYGLTEEINRLQPKDDQSINQALRMSSAMERGSVEAYSAVAKAGNRVQDRIADNTGKAAAAAEKNAQLLKEINDNLNKEFAIA